MGFFKTSEERKKILKEKLEKIKERRQDLEERSALRKKISNEKKRINATKQSFIPKGVSKGVSNFFGSPSHSKKSGGYSFGSGIGGSYSGGVQIGIGNDSRKRKKPKIGGLQIGLR